MNKQKALLNLVLMQFFEFQDYVIFNPQNPHEFVSNSKTQVIFYLWVSRDVGSCVSSATKEVAGGLRGWVSVHNWGHSADLPLPCSLPLPDPKVVWAEYHTPSTPTLVRPSCGRDALHLSHSYFPMGLVPFSSFWKEEVEGEDVLCSLEDLGAFPALATTVWGQCPDGGEGHAGTAELGSKIPVLDVFSAFPRMTLVCSMGHHS